VPPRAHYCRLSRLSGPSRGPPSPGHWRGGAWRMSRGRLVVAGAAVYAVAAAAGYAYARGPPSRELASEAERCAAYDALARSGDYQRLVGRSERFMGMARLRRRLFAAAPTQAPLLEVAAGPATNLALLGNAIAHTSGDLVLVDNSPEMVAAARTASQDHPNVQVFCMSAEDLEFPDHSFDAVVDTFGLCSYESPERALSEMSRVCRPGGRLLLLEHGRSTWALLNWYLDRRAGPHSKHWGCIWNRDIVHIVRQSGLHINTLEHYHLGTTVFIIATVPPSNASQQDSSQSL